MRPLGWYLWQIATLIVLAVAVAVLIGVFSR